MTSKRSIATAFLFALSTGLIGAAAPVAMADEPGAEALIDALNGVFGKHAARASHAKGQCVKGTFTPTAEAAGLSKAANFNKPVAVIGRFSIGGGNPKVADSTKGAVRGLALRFDLGNDTNSDAVMVSAPVFFARTPAQVVGFLQARVPGADGKPDPEKVKAFAAANPETAKQSAWLASHPVPASYASVNYWAVHAFTLTSAKGTSTIAKLKAVPTAGEAGLTDDEAKAKGADFYVPDLNERLAKGPATFNLVAILAEAGDPVDDPTAMWPEDARKTVTLGSIAITAPEADAACDAITFDPSNLPDGIAGPATDPIFAARSAAYAVSLSRRSK